jgi:hypothetical protein
LKDIGFSREAGAVVEIETIKTNGDGNPAPGKTKEKTMKFSEFIDWLSGAAKVIPPDTVMDMSNNSTPSPPSFSEADKARLVADTEKATRDKITAEFAEKQAAANQERTAAAHKTEIASFCEAGMKAGKILPAWIKMGLPEFLSGLDAITTVDFAEGDKKTPWEFMKSFLEGLPQVVNFAEFAKREKTDPAAIDEAQKKINTMLGVDDETYKKFGPRAA